MEERQFHQRRFQAKLDRLKDPAYYKEKYADGDTQQLVQALDIVAGLREEVSGGATEELAWRKLYHATMHLEKLLKQHFDTHAD